MSDLRAVIVAAGQGTRLAPLTDDMPKCFLPVGGRPLIEYSLQTLAHCGIEQIAIVVGYLKDQFPARLGEGYEYIFNPFYAITNDMVSLWFAKEFVKDSDFVYLHSDLLYHPDILGITIASEAEIALAVDQKPCDEEMMKVVASGLDLLESSKDVPVEDSLGEWTGIAKFTSAGWKKYLSETEELLAGGEFAVYDTAAMNRLVQKDRVVKIMPFEALPFLEIDYPRDVERAREEILPQLRAQYLEAGIF